MLEIKTRRHKKGFLVDQGHGFVNVCCEAWRGGYPNTKGYGNTCKDAVYDLKHNVAPDWSGELDGEGPYPAPGIGGNMFPRKTRR